MWWVFAGWTLTTVAQSHTFSIKGQVIDRYTRQGIVYANVYIEGHTETGTATDSTGHFLIDKALPGIHRLVVSCIGYKPKFTTEYMVSARTPFIEVELEEDPNILNEITVIPSPHYEELPRVRSVCLSSVYKILRKFPVPIEIFLVSYVRSLVYPSHL